ncbi:MAG: hypothetical protein ACRER2_05795 [Methylococcales bacterium]
MVEQIVGQLALGEQGVGRDGLAGQVEGPEERDDHPDLVGLLGLVAPVYGQGTDFFWVWQILVWWPTTPRIWVWRPALPRWRCTWSYRRGSQCLDVGRNPGVPCPQQGAFQIFGIDAGQYFADDGAAAGTS